MGISRRSSHPQRLLDFGRHRLRSLRDIDPREIQELPSHSSETIVPGEVPLPGGPSAVDLPSQHLDPQPRVGVGKIDSGDVFASVEDFVLKRRPVQRTRADNETVESPLELALCGCPLGETLVDEMPQGGAASPSPSTILF